MYPMQWEVNGQGLLHLPSDDGQAYGHCRSEAGMVHSKDKHSALAIVSQSVMILLVGIHNMQSLPSQVILLWAASQLLFAMQMSPSSLKGCWTVVRELHFVNVLFSANNHSFLSVHMTACRRGVSCA